MKEYTNIIEAMNTIRATKAHRIPKQLFVTMLMLVFFAMLLIAIISGVTVYKRVADVQITTNEERLALQLIGNYVRANDSHGTIKVGQGPEGRSLVLVEQLESGTYETRIYLYNGSIVQEYAVEGSGYTPGKALELVKSKSFAFSYSKGLLTITCDQGRANIALRSEQGGTQ